MVVGIALFLTNEVLEKESKKIFYFIRKILQDQQELSLIFDNLQQSIFIVDNGNIQHANNSFIQRF